MLPIRTTIQLFTSIRINRRGPGANSRTRLRGGAHEAIARLSIAAVKRSDEPESVTHCDAEQVTNGYSIDLAQARKSDPALCRRAGIYETGRC